MKKNAQKPQQNNQQTKAMKTRLRIKNPCKKNKTDQRSSNATLKAMVNKGYDIDVETIEAYYPNAFLDS